MNISVRAAKNDLSRIINSVMAGEEVIITRRNNPVARLVPFVKAEKRDLGKYHYEGFKLPEDFNESMELFED